MRPFLLSRLRFTMAGHKLRPLSPVRVLFIVGFAAAGAAFLAGDFLFFRKIFGNLLANAVTEDIPRILLVAVAGKLMGLVLLTTFSLLLFSAAVSALSYLYLDEDLTFLLPLPIPRRRLLAQRSMEAAANAGYMVALLLVPVAVAYWSLSKASAWTLVLSLTSLAVYLCVPLSLGIVFTVLLARFFPARRLHQVLTVLSVVMLCMLVVLFRVARPEALLNPESSSQVLEVLRSIRMPKESLLPSTWVAEVVVRTAEGEWDRVGPALGELGVLSGLCLVLAAACLRTFHWKGYCRAQEQQTLRPGAARARLGKVLLDLLVAPAPAGRAARAILRRDALLFFRDPTQWGQLIILAALVVIYLFNVRYMPSGVAVFKVAVSFWNLATLGLIVSSVAGRFAFTAVGAEGKAYFASRALPIDVWSYLWAKYLFTAVPLSALSALTLYGSNRFLGVEGHALAYSVFLAVCAAMALSALALCLGSAQPIFDARNPAKGVMSAWGLGYMFLSLSYVCVMLVLSARPVYQYYQHLLAKGPDAAYGGPALNVGGLSALVVLVSLLTTSWRLKALEAR
jgi:ABC-2 type transport system permease protein